MQKAWNSSLNAPTKPLRRTPFLPKIKESRKGDGKPRSAPKRGLRKVRKDTVGKLKAKLWQLCRAIIIKRHGDTCYTCGALDLVGSNLHLGHFIPSSVCSAELRYDLSNLRPCCYRCNIHLSGNWIAYEAHLLVDGIDVEALKQRNYLTKGMKADILFYRKKIEEYELLLKEEVS